MDQDKGEKKLGKSVTFVNFGKHLQDMQDRPSECRDQQLV